MVREAARDTKDRRSNDAKSSVRAPEKKEGGGGKFTMGKAGDYEGGATVDEHDPNWDPDEKRIDPDDGVAYKYVELSKFYKAKFTAQEIAEYWEYTCTAVKRKGRSKAAAPAGPTLEESAEQARAQPKKQTKRLADEDFTPEGPLAKEVAAVIPYYPFGKLDKFYDVQGLLNHPSLLNAVCAVLAVRFRKMGVTKIAAIEASGFLFAPVAIKLGKPFVMLCQPGRIPNAIKQSAGEDTICVQKGAIKEGDKVAILDDLLTTGGMFCAGIELMKACKAEVVECTCLVELKALNGREKCLKAGAKDVWGFIFEELLTKKGMGYVDDGDA